MAGKISIYLKDDSIKSDIEAIARYDRVSITQLIAGILKDYADTRADAIAVIRRQDAEIDALKAQASTDAQAANDDDDDGQQAEQAEAENENWRRAI